MFAERPLQSRFFLSQDSTERDKGEQGEGMCEWSGSIWRKKATLLQVGSPFGQKEASTIVRPFGHRGAIYKYLQLLFNKHLLTDHVSQALCIMLRVERLCFGEFQEELDL